MTTRRSPRLLLALLALAAACGTSPPPPSDRDAASTDVVAVDTSMHGDDAAALDALAPDAPASDAPAPDASAPDDAGSFVRCGYGSPRLLVTAPIGGGAGRTMLRLSLVFSGGARGVRVTSVSQREPAPARRDAGAPRELRRWDVASLRAPAGFGGDAPVTPLTTEPEVLWLAEAPSIAEETAACMQPQWNRDGTLVVTGETADRGPFTLECPLSTRAGAYNPTPLFYACARGVPGWVSGPVSPSFAATAPATGLRLVTFVHLQNTTSSPVTGLAVTGGTVRAFNNGGGGPAMPPPWELDPSGHEFFLETSAMPWSGPVPANTLGLFSWYWRAASGGVPAGYCNPPPMPGMLRPPTLLVATLRGNSSAGAFEWESDSFVCVTPM